MNTKVMELVYKTYFSVTGIVTDILRYKTDYHNSSYKLNFTECRNCIDLSWQNWSHPKLVRGGTNFGSQKWSPGQILAAKIGPTLPKLVLQSFSRLAQTLLGIGD